MMLTSIARQGSRLAISASQPFARAMASTTQYETLKVDQIADFVSHVQLNRPDRANAMNKQMWAEIRAVFDELSEDPDTRAVVVSGSGKGFTGGLDLQVSIICICAPVLYLCALAAFGPGWLSASMQAMKFPQDHMDWFMQSEEKPDPSRIAFKMMKTIKSYQDSMSALEKCSKV